MNRIAWVPLCPASAARPAPLCAVGTRKGEASGAHLPFSTRSQVVVSPVLVVPLVRVR